MSKTANHSSQITQPALEPVVIRCGAGSIKGYLESPQWTSADEAQNSVERAGDVFRIRALHSSAVEEVPAGDIKAVFFVNSLEGADGYVDLQFHSQDSILPGIWIHVKFRDGEVIEGVVENSIRSLVDPGFFLRPTDPGSNNKLIYVMKSSLAEYHVLGLTRL